MSVSTPLGETILWYAAMISVTVRRLIESVCALQTPVSNIAVSNNRLTHSSATGIDAIRRRDTAGFSVDDEISQPLDSAPRVATTAVTSNARGPRRKGRTVDRGNQVLPKLPRASRPLILRWKRGPTLDSQEMDRRVTDHLAQRKAHGGPG
jgi:hypothetical protein